jgi:hypothetical protein
VRRVTRVILPNKRLFVPKKPAVLRIWDEELVEYTEGGGGIISAASGGPQSLVLNAASSQRLTLTSSGTATNYQAFTISFWFKRSSDAATYVTMVDGGNWNGTNSTASVRFNGANIIDSVEYITWNGSTADIDMWTTTTFTDTTNWHHVCVVVSVGDATASNRTIVYVDGISFPGGSNGTQCAQFTNPHFMDNGQLCAIGAESTNDSFFDGKLAYIYVVDGQALSPSSFTTGTGVGTIHPIAYTGSFGAHGFFLNFTGGSTADQSGNSNNWTAVNSPTFSSDLPT